jgi:antitoxin component YwqK of YwqJK toxin-antitoxin module
MMKSTILLLSFYTLQGFCLAQNSSRCLTDKLYFNNGQIQILQELDSVSHCNCGIYQEFDSTGTLLVDGYFTTVDSVECKGCYEGSLSFSNNKNRNEWRKIEFVDACSIRVGIWKTYHQNGKLATIGKYSSKIHASYSTVLTDFDQTKEYLKENNIKVVSTGPINIGISYDELKDGIWSYFDENGRKIKEEDYIDGDLITLKQ